MEREDERDGGSGRALKKSRCNGPSISPASQPPPPTHDFAASVDDTACVSEKDVIELLVQELEECNADVAKASAIMDEYRAFLSPLHVLESSSLGIVLLAAHRGTLLLVRYLVEKGTPVEPRGDDSGGAKHLALVIACCFDHLQIVQYLVTHRAQIN